MYKFELGLKGVVEIKHEFYLVHYHNRLSTPKYVSLPAISRDKVFRMNQVPITAELRVVFSVYGTYTVEKCRRAFKQLNRIEKEILPFFLLLMSARFSSVSRKIGAIRDFKLF